jgi:hypothetical protein
MLVASHAVGFVERFSQVGSGSRSASLLRGYPSSEKSGWDVATTMAAPLSRVPNGRPQSGGSACTAFHGTTLVRWLGGLTPRTPGPPNDHRQPSHLVIGHWAQRLLHIDISVPLAGLPDTVTRTLPAKPVRVRERLQQGGGEYLRGEAPPRRAHTEDTVSREQPPVPRGRTARHIRSGRRAPVQR